MEASQRSEAESFGEGLWPVPVTIWGHYTLTETSSDEKREAKVLNTKAKTRTSLSAMFHSLRCQFLQPLRRFDDVFRVDAAFFHHFGTRRA